MCRSCKPILIAVAILAAISTAVGIAHDRTVVAAFKAIDNYGAGVYTPPIERLYQNEDAE